MVPLVSWALSLSLFLELSREGGGLLGLKAKRFHAIAGNATVEMRKGVGRGYLLGNSLSSRDGHVVGVCHALSYTYMCMLP